MNDSHAPNSAPAGHLDPDSLSELFANMVIQHANMALMFLGKVTHPETGQTFTDLDAARLFIDQLEMLEVKTKGNLSPEEAAVLKQSLMTLRLAFVETVEAGPAKTQSQPAAPAASSSAPAAAPAASSPESEEERRKKFSKKY